MAHAIRGPQLAGPEVHDAVELVDLAFTEKKDQILYRVAETLAELGALRATVKRLDERPRGGQARAGRMSTRYKQQLTGHILGAHYVFEAEPKAESLFEDTIALNLEALLIHANHYATLHAKTLEAELLADAFPAASKRDVSAVAAVREAREEMLTKYSFLPAEEFVAFAGMPGKNPSRCISKMKENGYRLLSVKHERAMLYPTFQLEKGKAKPFPELTPVVERAYEHDLTDWDICLWLTAPQEITLKQYRWDPVQLSKMPSYKRRKKALEADAMKEQIEATPIELLHSEHREHFERIASNWFEPESVIVPTEVLGSATE